MALNYDDISINAMIGASSCLKGNIVVSGGIMVNGDIDGNIECTGNIIVGEGARIKGNVIARSATISGIILGNVVAPDGIRILSKATLIGDISTKRLQIEDKVVFHGYCISIADEQQYEKEFNEYSQSKEIRNKVFVR